MKKPEIPFLFEDDKISLNHKNVTTDIFSEVFRLKFVEQRFAAPNKLNVIGVSPAVFSMRCHEKWVLINQNTNDYINVSLERSDAAGDDEFLATSYLRDVLKLKDGEVLYLCKYKDLSFKKVLPQKIDRIRESELVISPYDSEYTFTSIASSPCKCFEVYHTFSGDSLVVKKNHIFIDETLEPGTIRLSRKQRLYLGLELPLFLSDEQWSLLTEQESSEEERQVICALYGSEDHVLDKTASYSQKALAKKIIGRYCPGEIRIIPVPESTRIRPQTILRRLSDFYVGKSTISLVCRRPYDIDEGLDIVRMTKSNMSLLGIDEMDKVILQYKNKKLSCRVLELEDEEAFLETNLPISLDLVIGIPAHIRKKLGIMDLSTSIKIDRDTAFIFKKSINEQVVPILLTLFSTNLFTDSSMIFSAALLLVAIPIVLYFNLSSKRNMRA